MVLLVGRHVPHLYNQTYYEDISFISHCYMPTLFNDNDHCGLWFPKFLSSLFGFGVTLHAVNSCFIVFLCMYGAMSLLIIACIQFIQ